MSPRYEHDPSKVSAVIAILDKGDYELIIGEPKAFFGAGKDGKADNYGVRYPLTVAEGPEKGSKTFYSAFIHSDGALSFSKQFLMAALGFKPTKEDEKRFNEKYQGSDWSIDTDTKGVGDVWREATGKRLMATVDVGIQTEGANAGSPQQKWVKFRPL
jgi:hypothetical protein